jgi:uncharacterized membrane protein YphA (DoxX/SURF4 family)
VNWVERLLRFHKDRNKGVWRHPDGMGKADVEEYLTYLAVKQNVAPATLNKQHSFLKTLFLLTMPTKTQRLTGWILTVLLGLFLMGASGVPKFMDFPQKEEMLGKMGIDPKLMPVLGVIEIGAALLFLIPRTSFLGAILLTGYLGGAIFTHVRINDPWFFPVILGVLVWTALGLRQPLIFRLAAGMPDTASPTASNPGH